MKILKTIGLIFAGLIIIVAILALIAPSEAQIQATEDISAGVATVWKHTASFKNHEAWAPWNELDPNMKQTYSGPDAAVGSKVNWEGNADAGVGEQEIIGLNPLDRLDIKVRFLEPYKDSMQTWFTFKKNDKSAATQIEWGGKYAMPFPQNVMNLFIGIDDMIQADFQKGLSNLKTVVEADAKSTWGYEVQEIEFPGRAFVVQKGTVEFKDIGTFYATHFPAIMGKVGENGGEVDGMPCGLYYSFDNATQKAEMAAAIPVKGEVEVDGYETVTLPAGKALLVDYYGPYEEMDKAYNAMDDFLAMKGIDHVPPFFEEYVTDPTGDDPSQWLSKVYYLLP